MWFNAAADTFVSQDVTVLSEHITETGIIDMAYQQEPDSILWLVRADGQLDDATKAMAEIAKTLNYSGQNIRNILDRNYFDLKKLDIAIKSGELKNIYKLVEDAARSLVDTPVPYFESKPKRAVGLNEYADAVIPKDVNKKVIDILKKNGIPFVKYDKAIAGDREAIVRQFTEQLLA